MIIWAGGALVIRRLPGMAFCMGAAHWTYWSAPWSNDFTKHILAVSTQAEAAQVIFYWWRVCGAVLVLLWIVVGLRAEKKLQAAIAAQS